MPRVSHRPRATAAAVVATGVLAGLIVALTLKQRRAGSASGEHVLHAGDRVGWASQPAAALARFDASWQPILGELQRTTDPEDARQLAELAAASVDRRHLARAVEHAARLRPSEAMQELIGQLLLRWAELEPTAAAERARRGLQPFLQEATVELLFARVRESDAGAAVRFAAAMGHCASRAAMVAAGAAQWARQDWPAALGWLAAEPEGRVLAAGADALIAQAAPGSLPEIATALGHLSSAHAGVLERVAARWAAHDAMAASIWAATLPIAETARRDVVGAAVAAWAREAPAAAAGFALSLPPGFARDEAALQVVAIWGASDPAAAAAWLGGLPDEELRAQAGARLVAAWSDRDPGEAGRWLAALPEGRGADLGYAMMSRVLAPHAPAAAFAWADAIGLTSFRHGAMESAARQWLAADPSAALPAISGSGLPAGVKRRLAAEVELPLQRDALRE